MTRTFHFKDYSGYRRWLAFGHIHQKFHGSANIMINGKHHAVVHKPHTTASHITEHFRNGSSAPHKINYNLGRGTGAVMRTTRKRPTTRTGARNNFGFNVKMPRVF